MSGIAGVFYHDGRPVQHSDLERMTSVIAHRGPDGCGTWAEGPVGLGQVMLRTTPESLAEALPLASDSGDLVITADARIDNRDELLDALGFCGSQRKGVTDGQLILAAYARWGDRCPERLLGDFAFAIWDKRAQTIFCARDHFGVRPFYYCSHGGLFAFASEIKSLLSLPGVPARLNEERVAEHLMSQFDDTASTFYQDIFRLPPAHSMTATREWTRVRSYWSLDPSRELRLGSDAEYAEGFREHFTEAVRCRLRSAVPVGSMLSGGLDSSSITCTARALLSQNGQGPLSTFSALFDEVPQCDERRFISAVTALDGIEPHYLRADSISPLVDVDRVLWHQDEPLSAGNLYINWSIYQAAKEHGVRVILDGFDGDTTVSHGTGYMKELARSWRWLALASEVKGYAGHFGVPWRRALWSWMWRYSISPAFSRLPASRLAKRAWQMLPTNRSTPHRPELNGMLNPSFLQRVGLSERRKATRKAPPQTEREEHYRRLTWGGIPHTNELLDKAASAFSIELRFPFWDKRLVEYCLALPPQQKLHRGWDRMVMRRAMEGILPEEIRWRCGKTDLQPAFDRGLLKFERSLLDNVLLKNTATIEAYVNADSLKDAYRRYAAAYPEAAPHPDPPPFHGRGEDEIPSPVKRGRVRVGAAPTDADMLAIWKAVSLAVWLRRTNLAEKPDIVEPAR